MRGITRPSLLFTTTIPSSSFPFSQTLRLLSSQSPSKTSAQIINAIRHQPRWESSLLSQIPPFDLFNPTCINLTLSSLSPNPLLSLRFLLFLSSQSPNPTPIPTPIPTPFLNSALASCLRARRTDLLFSLYHRFTSAGSSADQTTASLLIRAFLIEDKLFDAYRTLCLFSKNSLFPDVPSNSALIAGFVCAGNYAKVSELLHLMIAVRRMPDAFTYNSIVHGLFENGMGEEALRVFGEIKLRGYPIDVVNYSTVIDGLCKMGRVGDARRLLAEMVGKGMRPNRYTYHSMIDGCFKGGDFEEGRRLYCEMIDVAYDETAMSCNIMINGLCLCEKVSEAVEMFEEMRKKGTDTDVITYNTLIQGLCRGGRRDEALRLYGEVLEVGLQLSVSTYTPLIVAVCNEGDVMNAVELVEEMKGRGLEPLVCTNDCIIGAFCKVGKVEEGLRWLMDMLKENLRPRAGTFDKLVVYLSSAGRVDDVLALLNMMFDIGYLLSRSVCHDLVDRLCNRDTTLESEKLLEILLTDAQPILFAQYKG